MLKKIKETTEFIKKETNFSAENGIVLGTGLGGLINEIDSEFVFSYEDIPNFPLSTVEGHSGKLILGNISGVNVIAMQGRFHFYEGYKMEEVTFPIRIMKELGVKRIFLSNASGGVNPNYNVGDLMIINDHINFIPNPLIGKNLDSFGPRFPDMSTAYDKKLIKKAINISIKSNIPVHTGVYVAVTGPCLETPAEYNFIRIIGGDTVGMSTAPEVIIARHMKINCFAISVITDLGVQGKIREVSHEEIQLVAESAEPKLTHIIKELILT